MSTFVAFGCKQIGWTILPSRVLVHLHPTPIALDVSFGGYPLVLQVTPQGQALLVCFRAAARREAQKVYPLPVPDPHYPNLF